MENGKWAEGTISIQNGILGIKELDSDCDYLLGEYRSINKNLGMTEAGDGKWQLEIRRLKPKK